MLHARRIVSAISLLFAGLFAIAHAAEYPGAIPGGFNVGSQGSGTYTIPIATPAATGGLKPSLALTYNHLAGNGLAGMRWTLSGFSSITRCQQTYAQDEDVVAISYGSDDRYCLDGQRLVNTSGDYHVNGTQYGTEIETFQRVFQSNTAGAGAQRFYVQHGNGMTSYYGYTTDSRVEKVGASDVRIWYISYTEDQFGNRISYSYDENTSYGEVSPSGVSWTSNSGQGLSARYSVTINYESRPSADIRSGYLAGEAKWGNSKRISSIVVKYNGSSEISTYTLSYASPVTTDTERSQLEEVLLCRGSDCLPETVFSWQDGTEGFDSASDSARPTGSNPLVGDFNNDGHMDLFVSLSSTWRIYKGTTAGGFDAAYNSGISSTTNPAKARVFDADGDGDSDLLYQIGSTWYLSKSTGSAMGSGVSTSVSTSTAPEAVMMDFDGDGLTDWLYRDGSNNLKWRRNTGTSFAGEATLETGVEYIGYEVNLPPADLNSDGRPDLMIGATGCYPWPPNCGIVMSVVTADGAGYTVSQVLGATTAFPQDSHAVDINGDGSDDMIFVNPLYNVWYLALGRGDGTFNSTVSTGISYSGNSSSIALDYNHDGRTDLLSFDSGSAEYDVHLSTGSNLNSTAYTTVSSGAAIAMDVTGDGYRDLVYAGGDGDWHVRKASSDLGDVVTTFTNGLGYSVDVTYETLAQTPSDHYLLDSGDVPSSVYEQQFSGARYVVTHEDHDDGIGGTRNIRHKYDTAFLDRSGRGWLSFDWHRVRDDDSGTTSITYFRQDWPYAGRATYTNSSRSSDSQKFRENSHTWSKTSWTSSTPDRHFIRIESTTSKDWEIGGTYDGTLLRTVVDNPTFNTTYGYVEERTVTTTENPSSDTWTTHTDYNPTADTDANEWCLGLPGLVTTTNTNPDTSNKVRKLDHTWNGTNCSLTNTTDKSEAR